MKKFNLVMLVVGLAVFAWLVRDAGLDEMWSNARAVGLGVVPFVLVEALSEVFHTLGMRFSFRREHRNIPFLRLWSIRLSGAAVNYVTPAGTGGEVVKATLLKPFCPIPEATSAVLIDKLTFTVAQLGLASVGSSFLLLWIDMEWWIASLLWGGSLLIGAGLVGFFVFQRKGKMSSVFRVVCGFFAGDRGRAWVDKHIADLDERLKAYHATHGWDFLWSILLHVVAFACGWLQAAYFLWLVDSHVTPLYGAGIWLLATWFDMASVLVPAGIGIQEASRFFAFQLLGLPKASGVTYALLLRVEQLTYTLLGFACYGNEVRKLVVEPAPVVEAN